MRKLKTILAGVSSLAILGFASGAQAASFVFNGGVYVPGTTSPNPLLAPDVLNMSTGSSKSFSGTTFTNQSGTVNWQGGPIFLDSGAVINNQSLWDTNFNGSMSYNGGAATAFNNSGVFRKSGGAGSTTIGGIGFANSGMIDAQTGTISFAGPATFNAGSSFIGAGIAAINTTATFNGAISSANLSFASGSYIGNAASLTGSAGWSAGAFTGGWTLTNGSTLTVLSGSSKILDGATFINDGTIDWQGGPLFLSNGSQLVNNGTVAYAASSSVNNNGGPISTVTNSATGLIRVNAGEVLTFGNRFVNDGGTLTADGTINFNGGNAVFNDGTTFNGTGTNAINTAAAFNGAIGASNLRFAAGVYTGTDAVLNGSADWASGTFSGDWNLTSGSTMTAVTGSSKILDGATFINDGTIDWQGGSLFFQNGSQLVNNGMLAYAASSSLNNNGGAISTITNSATGLVRVDAGEVLTVANRFVNDGGTLTADGTINFNGGNAVFNDGTAFNGTGTNAINAAAAFNGAIGASNLRFAAGAYTGADAVLNGSADWASGTFSGDWNLTSGSTLTAVTGSSKILDGATFINDGTIAWQGGALFFQNGSQLVNNGTLAYAASSSLNNNGGLISTVTNSATGLIRVDAGETLTVSNRLVNNGGTLTADGTINFAGSNAVFNGGTTFNGAGTNLITSAAAFNGAIGASNLRFAGGVYTGTGAVLDGSAAFAVGAFSGDWNLTSGSTLTVVTGSNKLLDSAMFVNDGAIVWQGGALFLSNGSQLVNDGSINFQIDTSFNNNGGAASSFTNNGLIEKTGGAGTTTLASGIGFDNNGVINVLSGTIALPAAFTNDGTLGGTGVFASTNLTNAGSIAPGVPGGVGTLALSGNFSQTASGRLQTQLASGTSADLFNISGSASLGGTLALSCILSCAINDGDSFIILDSVGALSGVFANITTSGFLSGFSYDVVYDYQADLVRLTVLDAGVAAAVPEPATWAMMIGGFGLVGLGLRRRRHAVARA